MRQALERKRIQSVPAHPLSLLRLPVSPSIQDKHGTNVTYGMRENGLQPSAYPVKIIEQRLPGCVNLISLDCGNINIKLQHSQSQDSLV